AQRPSLHRLLLGWSIRHDASPTADSRKGTCVRYPEQRGRRLQLRAGGNEMAKAAVTAVERALAMIEEFAAARRPLSLTELSRSIGAPKSSCHAIVGTLVEKGYLYSLSR